MAVWNELTLEQVERRLHPYSMEILQNLTLGEFKNTTVFIYHIWEYNGKLPSTCTMVEETEDTSIYSFIGEYNKALQEMYAKVGIELICTMYPTYEGCKPINYRVVEYDKTFLPEMESKGGFYVRNGCFYKNWNAYKSMLRVNDLLCKAAGNKE